MQNMAPSGQSLPLVTVQSMLMQTMRCGVGEATPVLMLQLTRSHVCPHGSSNNRQRGERSVERCLVKLVTRR